MKLVVILKIKNGSYKKGVCKHCMDLWDLWDMNGGRQSDNIVKLSKRQWYRTKRRHLSAFPHNALLSTYYTLFSL